jgi:hypothetical protein
MQIRHAVPVLALVFAGCPLGTGAGNFQPTNGPAGISVELRATGNARLTGELLEVRDSALLILADGKVRLARFQGIKLASFHQRAELDFADYSPATARQRLRMREVARFPTGLSPELLQKMLQLHGQTEESLFP